MSNPVSTPVVPATPALATYGFDQLNLFKTYTRESYKAAFGVDAPAADPTRPEQNWFYSGAPDPFTYEAYDLSGPAPVLKSFTLPAAAASTPNFPGAPTYPAWVPAPSGVTVQVNGTNFKTTVNPQLLSTLEQAQALAAKFGLPPAAIIDGLAEFSELRTVTYAPGETRKGWILEFNGQPQNVGLLLNVQYGSGVGAPGSWSTNGSAPVWTSLLPTGEVAPNTNAQPVPQRHLDPDHEGFLPFMGQFLVTNKAAASAAGSGAGLTADQAKLMIDTNLKVSQILVILETNKLV